MQHMQAVIGMKHPVLQEARFFGFLKYTFINLRENLSQ